MKRILFFFLAATAAFAQTAVLGPRDYPLQAAPAAPASGSIRVYADTATGKLACKNSSSADCMPSGSACTVVANSGDYLVPGAGPGAYGAYATMATISPSASVANTTLLAHIYVPCAFTPDRIAIYVSTQGSAGCKMEAGLYDNTKALVLHSGVLTDATTVACNSGGVKVLSASTSPAAVGLGTTYPAGWYWIASTSNETAMVIHGVTIGGTNAGYLLNGVTGTVGTLGTGGAQVTTNGALNASFTLGSGWAVGNNTTGVAAILLGKN